jgi:gas vesicle protein
MQNLESQPDLIDRGNMMLKKSLAPAALQVLEDQKREIKAEIGALQSQGVRPIAAGSTKATVEASARALLGAEQQEAPNRSERLRDLHEKLAIIDRAIEIESQRAQEERATRSAQLLKDRSGDWQKNIRETALAIARLQKLNRERDELVVAFGGATPPYGAEVHHRVLLGTGRLGEAQGDGARRFIEQAVLAGIISRKEVENVK